jgi:uncharacterized RDD family membrane protein YckC
MKANKKVLLISLSIVSLGLFSECILLEKPPFIVSIFINAFDCLRLELFQSTVFNIFIERTEKIYYSINTLTIFVFLLLVIGIVFYWLSKGKETRLVRFVLSIILLSSVVGFGYSIFRIFYYQTYPYWLAVVLVNLLVKSIYIYFIFFVLNHFKMEKELVKGFDSSQKEFQFSENEASNWQRMIHLLLDTFICLAILSFTALDVFKGLLTKVSLVAGEKTALFLFYLMISFLYYLFFEYFFGSTPSKMLTEVRVVNEKGDKASLKSLAIRSLARRIPFDSISFLSAQGWHDRLSETKVVLEKRTGVKGIYYFFTLLILISAYAYFLIGSIH